MATYYHGNPSEIGESAGGDGLQTLILMNPAYVGYSDDSQPPPPQSSDFVFLNHNSPANNAHNLSHAQPYQTQHFVGIPLQGTTTSTSAASPHDQQDVSAIHGFLHPRLHYNLYNLPTDIGAARDVTRSQQGLSLSLSSQQPPPCYGSFRTERPEVVLPSQARDVSPIHGDDVRLPMGSPSPASVVTNGVNGGPSVLLSSKYLKAAQELLDEVVNVGRGATSGTELSKGQPKNNGDISTAAAAVSADGHCDGENSAKRVAELTTAERQEIQMKKAKLVNMLDEVEQRYRQYHHQMQMVTSWFEQAAGAGSAKTYTALALHTISKQFRCLKDAILSQIRATSKSLGEDECFEGKIKGSRLKYVDNQIRQQRALQQLGMIQHNAWRPQRGLPERSVSVLRSWLFEHFLHPYPKDSDKLMLAKQTGLTRSQVSNWFINARVRLWKPMVEEMYMEEMKEHDKNASEDNRTTSKSGHNEAATSKPTTPFAQSICPNITQHQNNNIITPKQDNLINQNTPPMISMSTNPTSFNIIGSSSEIESITHNSPRKLHIADMLHASNAVPSMSMDSNKPTTHERPGRDGFTLMGGPTNFIGGFGSYSMDGLGRFGSDQFQQGASYSGNGVSLTLGLPHCESLGAHQTFMPNHGMQIGRGVGIRETDDFSRMNAQTNAHSNNVYENISIQDRKRFASQLLPNFVS